MLAVLPFKGETGFNVTETAAMSMSTSLFLRNRRSLPFSVQARSFFEALLLCTYDGLICVDIPVDTGELARFDNWLA
jgi:hypothetical protein